MKNKNKELRKQIKDAIKEGNGAALRIPYSYHRIGKIVPLSDPVTQEDLDRIKRKEKGKKSLERLLNKIGPNAKVS